MQEVIFDILQQEEQEYLTYTTATVKTSYTSYPTIISLQRPDRILPPAQQLWEAWKVLGLGQYSPNFVPVIEDFDLLYRTLSSKTYTTLTKAIDGRRSLRDLSMLFRQHLLRLGAFLLPYIRQGAIDLKAVSPYTMLTSFPPTSQQLVPQPFSPSEILTQPVDEQDAEPTVLQTSAKPFLVACVDDSAYAGNQMRRIVERAGYQYFWIRESSQALPALIERQPDLIFLDWMMPPANGYDVCSQIRQAAQLKHTPIVVLTSKDTLVERIRAKLAAANEFMTKPIQPREVLATLHRHFPRAEAASAVGDGA
ncbi:MAG: response regulator [Coleofasciculaceae cyanobacterium SM2_3_26]|nr:response regulator [Coleofasciculaceae cyanobacterium SM2_3_26]